MTKSTFIPVRIIATILALLFVIYSYPFVVQAEEYETYLPESEIIFENELEGDCSEEIHDDDTDMIMEYNSEDTLTTADVVGEVEGLREETVKHFRLSDGRFVAVDYDTPVHYKDGNGEWIEFDNSLALNNSTQYEDTDDFAGYEPKKNDAQIKFAKNTKSSNLLRIKYEDYQIAFGILNAKNVKPVMTDAVAAEDDPFAVPKVKSEVKYSDLFTGVDLVYILDGNNIKEYFILSENAQTFEFKFEIKVKNVVPVIDDEGNGCLRQSGWYCCVYDPERVYV